MALNVELRFTDRGGQSPIAGAVVHRYQLRDAMSELFELTIELASTDPALDMHSVVGESVIVELNDEPAEPRIAGLIKGVRQLTSEAPSAGTLGASTYEVDVVPPLWLTTRRRDHRIFVDKDVHEILLDVLADYEHRIPPPVVTLHRPLPKREYVVQYGETDHDFLSRILAADGVAAFFDHARGSALTLIDDTASLTAPPASETPFLPASQSSTPPAHVFDVAVSSQIETSAVRVRDYNPSKIDAPLEARVEARRAAPGRSDPDDPFRAEPGHEAYVFEAGKFAADAAGTQRATAILDGLRARARTYTLSANFTQGPGTQIEIANHLRADANGRFLIIRSRVIVDDGAALGGAPATNLHLLECVPASVPFLPPHRPKPRIHSQQTAIVVGGEEGDVVSDEMGRVRIQFRWDRRDKGPATRMVRVSQAWAGGGYGFFALPRVGDEVMIAYLDGDPDEPLVVGRVHNSRRITPHSPTGAGRTISTWRSQTLQDPGGFNEILMDDAPGQERVEIHAERDLRETVEHDASLLVKHDETITVGHDRTEKVKRAYTLSAGSVTIACGPYSLSASKIQAAAQTTVQIEGGDSVLVKGPDVTIEAGTAVIQAGTIVLQAGGGSIEIGASGVTIKGSVVKIEGGLVDVDGGLITLN